MILQANVDKFGRVSGATGVSGESPFLDVAEQTLEEWSFRPARTDGIPHRSVAYVVFAFREPVLGSGPAPAGKP